MKDSVHLDAAGPPRRTLVSDEAVPAAELNPWDPHAHEWVELYRYLPFLQEGHDTAEPPRMAPELDEETGLPVAGEAPVKQRYEGDEFDIEKLGATHYQTTDPGAEVAFRCARCAHVEAVKVPASVAKRLRDALVSGALKFEDLSTLPHEQVFGERIVPGEVELPEPDASPGWLPEQRELISEQTGLPPAVAARLAEEE